MHGNIHLIVKEDKEINQIVEIWKIFDGDINEDSQAIRIIENLSIQNIIIDKQSNYTISIITVD